MERIVSLDFPEPRKMRVHFEKGFQKEVASSELAGEDALTLPFNNPQWFQKASIVANGRGIEWPNGYDICADWFIENQ